MTEHARRHATPPNVEPEPEAPPTRTVLARPATGGADRYGGLFPDTVRTEVPEDAADGWDERIWHRGPYGGW